MELIVKGFNGDFKRLNVDCNATVSELKKMISREFINLDDDSRSLSSYGLSSGSTVMVLVMNPVRLVSLPMKVFVKNEKNVTSTYDVDVNETVAQLQSKIYNKERIPVDQQRLIYNGMQLEGSKKLQDYNITPGSTILMTLRLRG